jgi:hypothetical protein
MAPNDNEGKTPRNAKAILDSAEGQIKKAKADAFQQKAKDLLQKRSTAQAAVDAIDAELEVASAEFDASL